MSEEAECKDWERKIGSVCVSERELHDKYDDMLDETDSEICRQYSASRILKEVDPIAYDVGFEDWLDSEEEALEEEYGRV